MEEIASCTSPGNCDSLLIDSVNVAYLKREGKVKVCVFSRNISVVPLLFLFLFLLYRVELRAISFSGFSLLIE